jgi:hypothetical protein
MADQLERRVLIEHDDRVNGLEGGEHVAPLRVASQRPLRALQAPRRRVAIETHDECIAKAPGADEEVDMPRM